MQTTAELIWVSWNTGEDDRERRTLALLAPMKPTVLSAYGALDASFAQADLVVLNTPVADELLASLIELTRTTGAKLLVRTHSEAIRSEVKRRFGEIGLLDADEGPELTKARIIRALAGEGRSFKAADLTPVWRKRLVGRSQAIQKVAETIRLVGPRKCTVLITGETGTGKEIVAHAIHLAGPRAAGPFVAINCSAVPAALLEAELFGHTRGAFTGATQLRVGRFEQARGGTFFLDEIGDLPIELQAKILRVLQEREFQRLGSSETVKVDVRIVAATNCDLRRKVMEGSFREDLFYRLNVVPLELPPLRARVSDVRPLAEHFLAKICADEQIAPKRLRPDAWIALEQYEWPGNVRQLENSILSAVILSENRPYLDVDDFLLPSIPRGTGIYGEGASPALPDSCIDFTRRVSALERSLLAEALRRTGGNKKAAAEMLRLKRTTLSAKVRVLELEGAA